MKIKKRYPFLIHAQFQKRGKLLVGCMVVAMMMAGNILGLYKDALPQTVYANQSTSAVSVMRTISPAEYVIKGLNLNELITDIEMADTKSYSVDRVQKILERNQSVLAKTLAIYRMTPNGHIYFTSLFVKPAQIIVQAQNQYRISARVILTLLQKEQSLLSKNSQTTAPNSRRMMFAMGYGALDTGDLLQMSGFDKQIMLAAKRLRALIDEAPKKYPLAMSVNAGKDTTILNFKVPAKIFVKNASSYALYRYTPYTIDPKLSPELSGGNYLFVQIYQGLFVR